MYVDIYSVYIMYYIMFVLSCDIRSVWLRFVDEIIVATRRVWSRWCLHVHIHVFVDFCILRIVSHTCPCPSSIRFR